MRNLSFFCHIHLYCTTTASSRVLLYSTYIETQNCPLRFPSQFPHPTVVRTSTSWEPDGFCNPVLTLDYVVPLPIMHRMSSQWLSFSGSFAQVLVTLSSSPFSSLRFNFLNHLSFQTLIVCNQSNSLNEVLNLPF